MFFISQSLIKEFFNHWGDKDHCPQRVYRERIKKDVLQDRLSWQKGRYFESMCIGTARGGREDDLPRKKNGDKTIDHQRIDEQVMEFRRQARNYMMMTNEFNVQVHLRMPLNDQFGLDGTLDIFPTTVTYKLANGEIVTEMALIDTKLTEDSTNTYGEFCWGNPQYIDKTQLMQYHTLVRHLDNPLNNDVLDGMPDSVIEYAKAGMIEAYYWVFGYRKGGFIAPIKVVYDAMKLAEYRETVRKTMSLVDRYETEGWQPTPGKLCATCLVPDCQARGSIVSI